MSDVSNYLKVQLETERNPAIKKLIVASAAALIAFVSSAALEKALTIQVADREALITAVAKVGGMTGNPMLAGMAAGMIPGLPIYELFGDGREGEPFAVSVYIDPVILADIVGTDEAKAEAAKRNPDFIEAAVAFPVKETKTAFLERHPGATTSSGVFRCATPVMGLRYVGFSADGKWAVAASKPGVVKPALETVKDGTKPMKGSVCRVMVKPNGVKMLTSLLDGIEASGKCAGLGVALQQLQLSKEVRALTASLKVSDLGIDFEGGVKCAAGGELVKMGRTPLEKNAFAFAPKDTIQAEAAAKGAGNPNPTEMLEKELAELAKAGIDTSSITVSRKGEVTDIAVDVAELVKYFGATMKDIVGKLAVLTNDACTALPKLSADSAPFKFALRTKGRESQWTMQERFDATFPEAASKPIDFAQFGSVYSLLLRCKDDIAAALVAADPANAAMAPLLKQLAPEQKSGMGAITWMEKDVARVLARISADEIRGIASVYNAAMGYIMMQAMQGGIQQGPVGSDDDDADEDED